MKRFKKKTYNQRKTNNYSHQNESKFLYVCFENPVRLWVIWFSQIICMHFLFVRFFSLAWCDHKTAQFFFKIMIVYVLWIVLYKINFTFISIDNLCSSCWWSLFFVFFFTLSLTWCGWKRLYATEKYLCNRSDSQKLITYSTTYFSHPFYPRFLFLHLLPTFLSQYLFVWFKFCICLFSYAYLANIFRYKNYAAYMCVCVCVRGSGHNFWIIKIIWYSLIQYYQIYREYSISFTPPHSISHTNCLLHTCGLNANILLLNGNP